MFLCNTFLKWLAVLLCSDCYDKLVSFLLYWFRITMPKHFLSPEASQREDCWYGYACRTQHHNEEHARKRNHVCRPTRGSHRWICHVLNSASCFAILDDGNVYITMHRFQYCLSQFCFNTVCLLLQSVSRPVTPYLWFICSSYSRGLRENNQK